jgi:hypothetical protein
VGYELHIDREGRLARVRLFGATGVEEQLGWIRGLVAHADWSPDFNVIVDARELVDVGLDYGHMRRVAHEAKRLDAQLGTGRHALVGHTSMLYGCCRMGEQLCQPCGREIVVFRDMAAAELWLGIREEEPSPHSCIRPRDPQVQPAAEKAGDGSKR